MKYILTLSFLFGAINAYSWDHNSKLGVTTVNGNSKSESWRAEHKTQHKAGKSAYTFLGHYLYGKAATTNTTTGQLGPSELNARNWNIGARYDREISSVFGWFFAVNHEGDRFSNIENRTNEDLGLRYEFIDWENAKDNDYLFVEAGARATQENTYTTVTDPDYEDSRVNGFFNVGYGTPISTSLLFTTGAGIVKTFGADERNLYNAFVGLNNAINSTFSLDLKYSLTTDDTIEDQNRGITDTDSTFVALLSAKY